MKSINRAIGYWAMKDVTNGLNDNIISNEDNRTSLAPAKTDPLRFEENKSGLPTFTGKLAVRNRKVGEMGFSVLTGVYNTRSQDGFVLDKKRKVNILAIDANTTLCGNKILVTSEVDMVMADISDTYTRQYGNRQFGAYTDVVVTVLKRKMFDWNNAMLNVGLRLEYETSTWEHLIPQ